MTATAAAGRNVVVASPAPAGNAIATAGGGNKVVNVTVGNAVTTGPGDRVQVNGVAPTAGPAPLLTAGDVNTLLQRAAAASASTDGIIAMVDRNGRILGVRVEGGVSPPSPATPRSWCSPSTAPCR